MDKLKLFRKRLIPEEFIELKDDEILFANNERIVTKWKTLKPRKDLHHGYSCYFLKEGFKVSKFYSEDNNLVYWYCDIVTYEIDKEKNSVITTDLLADVIVYPDGFVKVVDIDELVSCLNDGKIDIDLLKVSLKRLDKLLNIIYNDKFDQFTSYIERLEEN